MVASRGSSKRVTRSHADGVINGLDIGRWGLEPIAAVFDGHLNRQERLGYFIRGPEWAFAVPWGDREALDDVFIRCAAFWNGAGSLVVPVAADGRIWPQLEAFLDVTPVDRCWLHPSLGDRARSGVQRRFPNADELVDNFDQSEQHPLNLLAPSEPGSAQSMLVPTFGSAALRRIALACWGHIVPEDLRFWRRHFNTVEVEGNLALGALVAAQLSPQVQSPLRLTTLHRGFISQDAPHDFPYLFVFDGARFSELVLFWNFRARSWSSVPGSAVVGVPRDILKHPELLRVVSIWIRTSEHHERTPDLMVSARSALEPAIESALASTGIERQAAPRIHTRRGTNVRTRDQLLYGNFGPTLGGPLVVGAAGATLIAIGNGRSSASLAPPNGLDVIRGSARVVLRNVPSPLPLTPSLAARCITHGRATRDGLLVNQWSWGRGWEIDLNLPNYREALGLWARDHGFSMSITQDGRYAEALLVRLGELNRLDVLADDRCLKILDTLSSESRPKLVQRLAREYAPMMQDATAEELAGHLASSLRDVGIFLELQAKDSAAIGSAVGSRAAAVEGLVPLVEAGFVPRGRTVDCPSCNFPAFFGLNALDERIGCPACRHVWVLPVAEAGGRQEPGMRYRLDGLMARVLDQDVLPVLLTLAAFRRRAGGSDLFFAWPGIEFANSSGKTDVDLLVSYGGTVYCCEVKARAAGLHDAQLADLLDVASKLNAKPALAALDGEFAANQMQTVAARGGVVFLRDALLPH